jgi:hypothetical protein
MNGQDAVGVAGVTSLGVSTISPIVACRDVRAAVDFLCDACAFERYALHEDGERNLNPMELWLGDEPSEPREAGDGGVRIRLGSEHQLYVVVEDADAHHDRVKAAGARDRHGTAVSSAVVGAASVSRHERRVCALRSG